MMATCRGCGVELFRAGDLCADCEADRAWVTQPVPKVQCCECKRRLVAVVAWTPQGWRCAECQLASVSQTVGLEPLPRVG